MSKSDFKTFVRRYPELANTVSSGKTTWQSLYEIYDIYGENTSLWDNYITRENSSTTETSYTATSTSDNDTSVTGNTSISDLVGMIKNVDLETVQKGVNSLQKTIGLLQDLGIGGATAATSSLPKAYEARPIYKYFED